ncbi:MAG: PEP-CTERM sorting domain-containing protein, partial [Immundisolibacteraceae bacterium]|nr:PEP-CTERM sorting domain-containing protein [Immundisolibacteraceae bacterium]
FYEDFLFDVSSLATGYQLHFDFYEYEPSDPDATGKKKTKSVIRKAPFSHDAGTHVSIPEPGLLALLGLGFIGISISKRQIRS